MGSNKGIIRASGGLFTFGMFYAYLVKRLGNKHEGYTFLLVVFGNVVVLIVSGPIIGWRNAFKLFVLFAAAGLPMSLGDIIKGIALRESYIKALREVISQTARGSGTRHGEAKNDNPPQTPTAAR